MQTALLDHVRETSAGREAEDILRTCVHCGFCTATCPTYQLLGDELDGPRGRIYLIKQVVEGAAVGSRTQLHLDRCLTCRACETTCPSGVRYGRLLDIGRAMVERTVRRPLHVWLLRRILRAVIPFKRRVAPGLRLLQVLRTFLPATLRRSIPAFERPTAWPTTAHARVMLALEGCVQPLMAPNIDAATARVLDRLGIRFLRIPASGCCGALSYHLGAHAEGLAFARRNIDAWWPHVEAGAEAIIITASGCGTMVKEYGHLLRDDSAYAGRAARISAITLDIGQALRREDLTKLSAPHTGTRVAFHSPCSLQHGQSLGGVVESILRDTGFELTPVPDAHLCCGSAGTYAILEPALSRRLLTNKLAALESERPTLIGTANIGCLLHLKSRASVPVKHWIELLDPEAANAGVPPESGR